MPTFLIDEPASPDSNEYEVHEAIANAIESEVIGEGGIKGGRRIALIGEWGSGKSTIVRSLSARFKSRELTDEPTVFIVFDLWSHTGDALRRSFLLKLFREIDKKLFKGVASNERPDTWLALEKSLEYEERTVLEIKSQDYSPIAIFLLALVALYSAFGVIGDAATPIVGSILQACSIDFLMPWGKLIQLILTIFFSLIFAIITTSKERSDRNRACAFFAKFKSGLSQVVNHLSGNPSSSSTTTTQAQVMSSLVFEKYLSDMMDIAIQQSPKMKTIVVLDNLDRLNIKHLHDAWDNIQLFATYMDQGCGPAKNMWLILPVSQDTVDNLLNEDGNKTQQQALSKLFIIQYRIPKPIKTEWKNSTTHFIEEAFHGISPEEIQCIIALMNCYVTPSRLNNPREQKRVINEHVALSQLYPSVKVGSIAVFLYLRDKYEQLENPESKFESWVTSELARNSSGSMLPRGLDVEFVPAEIAMMTFGVLNPARAQEAMLSGGLLDLTFLQNLDLNTYIANANGSWEIIQDCIVQDGIGLSSRGGKERYIELLKRIDETNPTKEVDSVSKKKAFRSLEFFLEESDWPQVGGSAQVIISMLNESKELGESATKAIAAIKHSATGLQEFNSDRASSWAVEVSNFLQYLITYDVPIDSQAIAVEPGENLYFLLEAIAEQEDRVELAKIIDIGGDEALKDLLHAAVSERPSISNHKVAELIPHLNLLASENEPKASPDYSSYGLSREEGVALFYEIWGWYRYSKAPFCLLYLHNAIANNLFENEIYVKAKNEMEKGAAIALFIHRDLATFNNSACDQYAGMLKEAPEESMLAVKCFAFSPDEKIDDDRLQDIIEAIDNQTTHSLGVYMLNALFENAQVSSECPFWAALRLLSLPENEGDNALSANMASLYDPGDLMDCEFDQIAINLYLRLSRSSPSSEYLNWLREGILTLYYDYWIKVLTNPSSNEPLELLNLLFDEGALPEHFEDAFSDWDADIDTIGTDRRLSKLLPKLSCRAFSSITESLLEHFNDPLTWRDRLITYGDALIERNWLASLAPDKQVTVANAILDSRLAKQSEWLLRAVDIPQLDHDAVTSILSKAEKMLARKTIEKKPTFKSNVEQMVRNLKAKNGVQSLIE